MYGLDAIYTHELTGFEIASRDFPVALGNKAPIIIRWHVLRFV